MSLTVLVVVVFAGISLVVLAVHLSGGSNKAQIRSKQIAIERLAADFEEESAEDVHITRDRRTAFLLLASGMVGIVHSVGDMFLTRCLWPAEIGRIERKSDVMLLLDMDDLTWPGGLFEFEDRKASDAVFNRLQLPADTETENA